MAFYDSIRDGNDFVISFTSNQQQDFRVFAKGYTQAASVLAEYLLAKPRFSDFEAYPAVLLYRQAFELYLKGLYYRAGLISFFSGFPNVDCKSIHKHWLVPLAESYKQVCHIIFPLDGKLRQLSVKVLRYAENLSRSTRIRLAIVTQLIPKAIHQQSIIRLLTCLRCTMP